MLQNIEDYKYLIHGAGKYAVENVTGPNCLTFACLNTITENEFEVKKTSESGIRFYTDYEKTRRNNIFFSKKHYSLLNEPLIFK